MKLKDRFWLWGQDAGSHHTVFPIPGVNRMGCAGGAEYLGGIPNCCRVVFHGNPTPPFDADTEELRYFKQVVWSIIGDKLSSRNDNGGDDLEAVLRQARLYPDRVTGGVFDDFFIPETHSARLSIERMREITRTLHQMSNPLKLWIVCYAAVLEQDYSAYLREADVITYWSWTSADLQNAEEKLAQMIDMTPGKEHFAGCYLWNYGDERELTIAEMKYQLELYYRLMQEKRLDGVVVCSNNIADLGFPAVEYFREWFTKHRNEEI